LFGICGWRQRPDGRLVRNDLTLYERHAAEWWEPGSRWFRSLRSVNEFRFGLLEQWLGPRLRGARVIDLGCGGGFLAEPLARAGARVIGCDLSAASVAAARRHAERSDEAQSDGADAPRGGAVAPPRYVRADAIHPPFRERSADLVLLADVLEHLHEPSAAVHAAAALLRPGGHLYVNTISRSLRARLVAVTLAEGLGLIPRGTHDARLFIRPDELDRWSEAAGLERVRRVGESVRLAKTLATWTVHLRANETDRMAYSVLFRLRPPDAFARASTKSPGSRAKDSTIHSTNASEYCGPSSLER
jgi:2-polyprenyl-6-hydroxyphenyl methylase/3-demethylubiquinone-9 3-methyltransferase